MDQFFTVLDDMLGVSGRACLEGRVVALVPRLFRR